MSANSLEQPKLRREITRKLAPDPLVRQFLDRFKDHSNTAYHNSDVDWKEDVATKVNRLATRKHGQIAKNHVAAKVDVRDEASPDNWIPRDPDLVRLTSRHPFNAEPNSVDLHDQGFITPVSMHYVRNHGKVPLIIRENHRLTIGGLVERPTTFTMDNLLRFPSTTLPITIVSAGNRRKEVNVISKTVGFDWATSALSCNMWTGVKLSVLLEHCGVDMEKARFVWFDGIDSEGLPMGSYGTCVDILTATNPYDHVLVAWEQNGIPLTPDHGYPLRVIVPGWVGSRSVKWLERVWVSERGSGNFYHFHDGRILPPQVDMRNVIEEGWWYREKYLFNQLNVNSVIAHPYHKEVIPFRSTGSYTVRGYAYSGGGRKVTRVEVSLDVGKTWRKCSLRYPEEKYSSAPKYGRYYCWMFWELDVDESILWKEAERGGEIRCRAWDAANNTQPENITWNLLGMGNNSHFVIKYKLLEEHGVKLIEFSHPVGEAGDTDGWMVPPQQTPSRAITRGSHKPDNAHTQTRTFSLEEVAKHNTTVSVWLIVDGSVFDVTSFLSMHPGGPEIILANAGQDVSQDFDKIHPNKAYELLDDFYIGELDTTSQQTQTVPVKAPEINAPEQFAGTLNRKKWTELKLLRKMDVNHDSRLFKFKVGSGEFPTLPVGYHVFLQATIGEKTLMRAYKPVNSDGEEGTITLLVKVYFAGMSAHFPAGGRMTQFLDKMKVGDKIKVKGPYSDVEYKGRGKLVVYGEEREVEEIGLLCGGSGITAAFQIVRAIYEDEEDETKVKLLYANKTESDILLQNSLDKMAAERENIEIWYAVENGQGEGGMFVGKMSKEMIERCMPKAGEKCVVGMCGPALMITEVCVPGLGDVGHKDENLVVF